MQQQIFSLVSLYTMYYMHCHLVTCVCIIEIFVNKQSPVFLFSNLVRKKRRQYLGNILVYDRGGNTLALGWGKTGAGWGGGAGGDVK